MHSFEAQNEHFLTYLFLSIGNTLKGTSVIATHFLEQLTKLPNRVSGYRYRGLGFDSRRYQIF